MPQYEENHRDRWCLCGVAKSIPSVLLLNRQTVTLRVRLFIGTAVWPRGISPSSSFFALVLSCRLSVELPQGASPMEWITPQHEEIDLNCEISSYANAEL